MSRTQCCSVFLAALLLLTAASAAHSQLDPNAYPSLGTLNISSGTLNINTDGGPSMTGAASFGGLAITQNDGPQVAVFDFSSINIGPAVTVNISGSRPFALLSQGNATIQTALYLPTNSGLFSNKPIAGGYIGAYLEYGTDAESYAVAGQGGGGPGGGAALAANGAGGGGYGGKGGPTANGVGGLPYGNLFQTLQGGSGGGAVVQVGFGDGGDASGGAGGGAVEVVAVGTLTVATVAAIGSNGTGSTNGTNYSPNYQAGGGAGGGILLSGGTGLTVTSTLDVRGGDGGDAAATSGTIATAGGGGRIALAGLSSYTLGSNPFTFNLNGGNSTTGNGFAGVITVDALTTTINGGTSVTLTGDPIVSVAGSLQRTSPTIEAYARHDLSVTGTVILGADNAFQRLDATGKNITTLFITQGTFDLNGYSEKLDLLSESFGNPSLVKLPAGSTLTVGVGGGSTGFVGQFTGAGSLVKAGSGTWTLSGTSPNFTGPTTVTGGTLTINGPQALQSSTVTLAGGGLSMGFIADAILGALAGTGNISLTGLGFNSMTVGGNNASTTFAGTLSGSPPGGLIKAGSGVWTLAGTNTLTGPIKIQGGTVLVGLATALSASAPITVSSGATLDLNGYNYTVTSSNSLTLQGTLRLGGAGLSVASGATATYNGGTVSNGFLVGAGTQTLTGGATLTGVTTASSVTISQTGVAAVSNFTHNGQFNNAAGQTLNWTNGMITSAGRLTIAGTLTASDFVSDGVVTINGGGAINNSGSNLVLGGGSRTTINPSGALATASGTTIELNGGLLINNGTITGTTNVNYGSLAKGAGMYGVVNVSQGGVYAPGNSPGIVTAAAVSFDSTPVSSGIRRCRLNWAEPRWEPSTINSTRPGHSRWAAPCRSCSSTPIRSRWPRATASTFSIGAVLRARSLI